MNCLAGIVVYYGKTDEVNKCITAVVGQVEKTIVINNGFEGELKDYTNDDRVIHITNPRNLGVAKAYNQIFDYAYNNGYGWVILLDQDTVVSQNIINEYKKYAKIADLAVLCPIVYDVRTKRKWPVFSGDIKTIDRCISSGSFNSVEVWKQLGGFDETFFIDNVDDDYCYRLLKAGKKIVAVKGARIRHKIGSTQIYRIFGKEIFVRNHSPFRKYYIARNRLLMDKKKYGHIKIDSLIKNIGLILKTIVFEQNRIKKVEALWRGTIDGVK